MKRRKSPSREAAKAVDELRVAQKVDRKVLSEGGISLMTWNTTGVQKGKPGKFIVDADFEVMGILTRANAFYKTEGIIYVIIKSKVTTTIWPQGILASLVGSASPRYFEYDNPFLSTFKEYECKDKNIYAGNIAYFDEVLDTLRRVSSLFAESWHCSLIHSHFRGPRK